MLVLDEACIRKMDLVDRPLVERHVAVVAALEWDKVPGLDYIWLRKVLELYVLILQIEVTQCALAGALTS